MPIRAMMLPARLEALLLEVSTNPSIDDGDLEGTHRLVLKTVSDGLRVARVGVWMFDESRSAIRCLALADSAHKVESEDIALEQIGRAHV